MELFFLSDAIAASVGRVGTFWKGLVYCDTRTPPFALRQRTVSPFALSATFPPWMLSAAPTERFERLSADRRLDRHVP